MDLNEGIPQAELDTVVQSEASPEAKPEPETEPEADDDDLAEVDSVTLEDLQKMFDAAIDPAIERAQARADAREAAEAAEAEKSPEQKEIDALKAQLAQRDADDAAREQQARADRITHEVKSAVGKYKLTIDEAEQVAQFFKNNPALIDTWSFEKGVRYVLPEVVQRSVAPTPTRVPAAEPTRMVPASNGPAVPAKVDHTKYASLEAMTGDLVKQYGSQLMSP